MNGLLRKVGPLAVGDAADSAGWGLTDGAQAKGTLPARLEMLG